MERRLLACGGAVLLVLAAKAAPAAEREHAAHLHGVGTLNVAVEGEAVEIELIAPGADIVGFEHGPETTADRAVVENAAAALKNGADFFVFPAGAGCRQEEAEVESTQLADAHEEGGEQEGEEHAEFHARYRFRCDDPGRLTHMDVTYFERFPAAEELEVQAISAQGQSAGELTPSAARLKF